MQGGYLTVWRLRRMAVRVHWTTPLGALLLGRLRFVPGTWAGFLLVILVHELGHVALVRLCGLRVRTVDVHGAGGRCSWEGETSPLNRSVIAWGGVLAQAALFTVIAFGLELKGAPRGAFASQAIDALTAGNFLLAVWNLIPWRSLDGVEAWPIFPRGLDRWRARRGQHERRARVEGRLRAAAEVAKLEAQERKADPEPSRPKVVSLMDRAKRKDAP